MHAKLVEWRTSVGAKMPTPNTNPQTAAADAPRRRKQQRESDDE
jgi:hypothetical protein